MVGGFALAIVVIVALAAFIVPARVAYVEEIEIAAPAAAIYDAIRYRAQLMLWSAWPSETGSACHVEGTDGEVGARTVFLTKTGLGSVIRKSSRSTRPNASI